MAAYDTVLFDFDGVLIDSEPVHYECWREVLARFGIEFGWDYYVRHCIGVADYTMIEELCRHADPPVPVEQVWAAYPEKKAEFRRRVFENPPFPPAVVDFVPRLAPNYKLGVVSSSARAEVEPLLERVGLRKYMRVVVCGEDVSRHKPSPDPYLLAASALRAECVLVVEDSDAGLASARAAGFDAVHVPTVSAMPVVVSRALGAERRS